MKMQKVSITYTKEVELIVYVPEDMNDHAIRTVAYEQALYIEQEGWDCGWETVVSRGEAIDVPDHECRVVSAPGGQTPRPVGGSRFGQPDVMVTDDEGKGFVQPEDATWWLAPEKGNGGEP